MAKASDRIAREIAANPDKFDFQDVPADRQIVPENEAAYQAAYTKATGKSLNQPTSEMLWIEHEGQVYRGYSAYYPLFVWNSPSEVWLKCDGRGKKEGWGGVIGEKDALGYMII